jgi:hypothetical protein
MSTARLQVTASDRSNRYRPAVKIECSVVTDLVMEGTFLAEVSAVYPVLSGNAKRDDYSRTLAAELKRCAAVNRELTFSSDFQFTIRPL